MIGHGTEGEGPAKASDAASTASARTAIALELPIGTLALRGYASR